MNRTHRRGAKVYGKKTFVPGASLPAAIFTSESPPPKVISLKSKLSPVRRALDDVTNSLSNFRLDDRTVEAGKEVSGKSPAKTRGKAAKNRTSPQSSEPCINQATRAGRTRKAEPSEDPRKGWLEPLTKEYEKSGMHKMEIRKWVDILDEEWGLEKIAESSYAEVYKVSNCDGTSVLKVMALKPPSGPGSQRDTSVDVTSAVSEVLIMDMMAEIPGFLEFKGAHIIEGKPPRAIKGAYDAHAAKHESFFPQPGSYHRDQLFLALELGDAGTDIEHFSITAISQIWDIFFGIVIALSHGEELASFEVSIVSREFFFSNVFQHRDLHEGNVCVRQVGNLISCAPKQRHKFNYSGLEITLLDYTLSRATQGDVTIYRDLEEDVELFKESKLLQHQMYRRYIQPRLVKFTLTPIRMRTWAFFRSHGLSHPSFDKVTSSSSGTWKGFMPYTNVIWVYYLFNYTTNKYEGVLPLGDFLKETKELRGKLDPDRRCSNGGFTCASEILDYCVRQGWIDEEDLIDSDVSSFVEAD